MQVRDYFCSGKEWYFRFVEKRRKLHIVPAHPEAMHYIDLYLDAAGITHEPDTPLFRKFTNTLEITRGAVTREAVTAMMKYYGKKAKIESAKICSHSCRATAA